MTGGGQKLVNLTIPGNSLFMKILKLKKKIPIKNSLIALFVLEILLISLGSIIVEFAPMLFVEIVQNHWLIDSGPAICVWCIILILTSKKRRNKYWVLFKLYARIWFIVEMWKWLNCKHWNLVEVKIMKVCWERYRVSSIRSRNWMVKMTVWNNKNRCYKSNWKRYARQIPKSSSQSPKSKNKLEMTILMTTADALKLFIDLSLILLI